MEALRMLGNTPTCIKHTSAYVSIGMLLPPEELPAYVSIRQHTSACVSIRVLLQPEEMPEHVSIRQHTSAYVSIRVLLPPEELPAAGELSNGCPSTPAHT